MVVQKIQVKPHLRQKIPPAPDPMQGTNRPVPDPRRILATGRPLMRPLQRWDRPRARGRPLLRPAATWQKGTRPLPHMCWRANRSEEAWREAIQRGQWAPPWQSGRPQARASPAHGRISLGSCIDSGRRLSARIRLGSRAVSQISSIFHACSVCFFTHKMTIQISTNIS